LARRPFTQRPKATAAAIAPSPKAPVLAARNRLGPFLWALAVTGAEEALGELDAPGDGDELADGDGEADLDGDGAGVGVGVVVLEVPAVVAA
jgi:hypothetical protein